MQKNTFQTYNSQVHEPVESPSDHDNPIDRSHQSDRPVDRPPQPVGRLPHTEYSHRDATLLADGGTAWTDLTAFDRDILTAVAMLDCEPCYGLAIEQQLAKAYRRLNGAHCYHHLDSLVSRGLLENADPRQGTALDRRTSEYRLSDRGRTLVETQARRLVTSCGLNVPDGGERR